MQKEIKNVRGDILRKTLVWNGIRAEDMGVKIINLPPISLSTEKVNEVEIEGRDGFLTELDGYSGDTKPVEADYRGNNPQKILKWLRGSGEVIFGNVDDRYYKARISNIVPLEQIIENQLYNFPIEFRCQPFGYLLEGKNIIELLKPTTLYNGKADYESKPIVNIFGTGKCTLNINNKAFSITNIGGKITLDSELEEVYEDKGQYFESDDFPILKIGENNISWVGNVSKIEIIPNWRCV